MTTGVSEREANDALNAYVSIVLSHLFLLLGKLWHTIRNMERLKWLGARRLMFRSWFLIQISQLLSHCRTPSP
jgi:hypothetical protein